MTPDGTAQDRVVICHGSTSSLACGSMRRDLYRLLSEAERQRHHRYLRQANRDEHLLAHGMKRMILGRLLDRAPGELQFATGPAGKPMLATAHSPTIDFNLTHSCGMAALIASTAGPVGIDVESDRRASGVEGLLRIMSNKEIELLGGLTGAERRRAAFAHWTAREAMGKAVGLGLGLAPEAVSFEFPSAGAPRLAHVDPELGRAEDWQFHQSRLGGHYVLTAAIMSGVGRRLRWEIRALADLRDEVEWPA